MAAAKILGGALIALSILGSILYTLWYLGLITWLDPQLAVKIPILLITLFFFFVVGFIGYVFLATRPAEPINSKTTSQQK